MPDDPGIPITNTLATAVASVEEICQRTGFKVKRGQLVEEWDGTLVREASREGRHPLDMIRSATREQPQGSPSPRPADLFTSGNGPTQDEL